MIAINYNILSYHGAYFQLIEVRVFLIFKKILEKISMTNSMQHSLEKMTITKHTNSYSNPNNFNKKTKYINRFKAFELYVWSRKTAKQNIYIHFITYLLYNYPIFKTNFILNQSISNSLPRTNYTQKPCRILSLK